MILCASSKCLNPGLYDFTLSAVTMMLNGIGKRFNVLARRSLSTFDKIPNSYILASLSRAGFVSGNESHPGSCSAGMVDGVVGICFPNHGPAADASSDRDLRWGLEG